jgi:regulator of replication initiation timing
MTESKIHKQVAELESRIDELKTEIKQELRSELEAENEDLRERVDELKAENERLQEENKDLRERVKDLEDQPEIAVEDESDPIGTLTVDDAPLGRAIKSKVSEQDLEEELDELESRLGDATPTPEPEKTASSPLSEAKTPLEQIAALPEAVAVDQLTANQKRARFVASDVRDYAESVPAGWAITTSDLRRVLTAAFDAGHSQTVQRVMDVLDQFGDDSTKIVERRGTKRVVFDDDLVQRLSLDQPSHDVVTTAEG